MSTISATVDIEDGIAQYTITLDGVSDGIYTITGQFPEQENTYDTTTNTDTIELTMDKKTTMIQCTHVLDNTEILSPGILLEEQDSSNLMYDFKLVQIENGITTEITDDALKIEFFTPTGELIDTQYQMAPFTQLLMHDTGLGVNSSWGMEIAYVRFTYEGSFQYNPCTFLFMAEGYTEALFNSFDEEVEYQEGDVVVVVDPSDEGVVDYDVDGDEVVIDESESESEEESE